MVVAHTVTVKLPKKHAEDWYQRCGADYATEIVADTPRTITLLLTDRGLGDLISDSKYYSECMKGDWTDGIDYASAAERCLAALRRQGLTH